MAKQIIGTGSIANDKTGDALRTAFGKVNQNFTELYNGAINLTSISQNIIPSTDVTYNLGSRSEEHTSELQSH